MAFDRTTARLLWQASEPWRALDMRSGVDRLTHQVALLILAHAETSAAPEQLRAAAGRSSPDWGDVRAAPAESAAALLSQALRALVNQAPTLASALDGIRPASLGGLLVSELLASVESMRAVFPAEATLGDIVDGLIYSAAERSWRSGFDTATPSGLEEVLIALARPGPSAHVFDPCAGTGGCLVSAHALGAPMGAGRMTFHAAEVSEETWRLAHLRLAAHGIDASGLHLRDSLLEPLPPSLLGGCDAAIADLPHGVDLPRAQLDVAGFPWGTRCSVEFLFLQRMLASLRDGGRFSIAMSGRPLVARGADRLLRKALIDSGQLEHVIALPRGTAYGTSGPVFVLCGTRRASSRPETRPSG